MKKHNFTNRFSTSTTRKFEGGYYVDIVFDSKKKDDIMVYFYIFNEEYLNKMLMFGLHLKDIRSMYEHFYSMCKQEHRLDLLENNQNAIPYAVNMIIEPQLEKYIQIYKEEYKDEK